MSRNTIDSFITFAIIISLCVMWFVIGYRVGEMQDEENERQTIINRIDSTKWEK